MEKITRDQALAVADLLVACTELVDELEGVPTLLVVTKQRRGRILRRANDAMANCMRQPVAVDTASGEMLDLIYDALVFFDGDGVSGDLVASPLRSFVGRTKRAKAEPRFEPDSNECETPDPVKVAARDLLASCVELLDVIRGGNWLNLSEKTAKRLLAAQHLADAAIAKATGEPAETT